MSEENENTQTHVVFSSGTMVSHYRVINRIGAGGMGEVYLAEDTKLNRKVALKFLSYQHSQNEELKTRFMREAQASAKLSHQNIVHIYEVGEYQNRPFFAMEHVEGKSLRKYTSDNKLDIDDIIKLSIQICEGLQEAHSAGIVHRDIKPSNIVVDSKGRPRILDFGLATIVGTDQITKTGSTLGTVGYMSPEQIKGKTVDARSDLFSFGVILYELLADRRPFTGESEAEILNAIQSNEPEPLARFKSGVSDGLQRIVSKLLEKDPGLRYQSAVGVVSDLSKEQQLLSSASFVTSQPSTYSKSKSPKTKLIFSGASLLIVLVLLLVLKPWKVSISPSEEAVAAENLLTIMYFDNLADPSDSHKLGEIAANLLITDLSESQYINVVSSQRLYDILKLLGHEGEKKIGRDVATEVARTANSKWMLLGSILKTNPNIILTAQLVETKTGNAIASQRIEGNQEDDIFSIIDSLSIEIKKDLSLPAPAIEENDLPLSGFTTSTEAYKYYIEGWERIYKYDFVGAVEKFQKAIAYDSTFAMAYFGLTWSRVDANTKKKAISKALSYIDKVNEIDRYAIRARKAQFDDDFETAIAELTKIVNKEPYNKDTWNWIGILYYRNSPVKFEKAIACFKKTIEIDPLYGNGYNQLAYVYNMSGDLDSSIWAINKYIELAPDEPNPYDTRGDLYNYHGKLKEAKDSYAKALQIYPDFSMSKLKLSTCYMYLGQYDSAQSIFLQLAQHGTPQVRQEARYFLAMLPAWQGIFRQAMQLAKDGIAADKLEGMPIDEDKQWLMTEIWYELNQLDSALATLTRFYLAGDSTDEWWKWTFVDLVRLRSNKGDYDGARKTMNLLAEKLPDEFEGEPWWYAAACLAEARGKLDSAIVYYQKCFDLNPGWWIHFDMGCAYLRNGQPGKSVELLEKAANNFGSDRDYAMILNVTVYYYLARAYEESGWTEKAVENYEKFLDIWKNADPGLEKVEDAKLRLAKLKA